MNPRRLLASPRHRHRAPGRRTAELFATGAVVRPETRLVMFFPGDAGVLSGGNAGSWRPSGRRAA